MQKIIHDNSDGSITILTPGENVYVNTEKEFATVRPGDKIPEGFRTATIDEIAKKDVPAGTSYEIVDESDIPGDRYFRNAWKKSGKSLTVDMPKAREIQKTAMRNERLPLLEALDVNFMQALEENDAQAISEIKNKKQQLRDVTDHPDISKAKTPEDLKAITVESIISK